MPHPDGRETRAERHYAKCRGPLGFHVLTGTSHASPHKVTRELARALWRRGCDVSCEVADSKHTGWTRTSIRHLEGMVKQPFAFLSWGRGDPNELRSFQGQARIEIDVVDSFKWADPNEVRYINERVDLLIVPGQSSLEAYLGAGVDIPVEIVPHGVDTTVFQPWPKDEELLSKVVYPGMPRRGQTLFLTGGFLQERKGLRECIEAFRLACGDGLEASLIVLSNSGGHGEDASGLVLEASRDLPIGFLPGGLDEWSMARLYSSVDFFVSCHKMEAFGMMPLEALACGTPSILTEYDGPMQYMGGGAYWVPPTGTESVDVPGSTTGARATMAVVDVQGVSEAMLRMGGILYNDFEPWRWQGYLKGNARRNALNWTWDAAAENLVAAVEKHICPVRVPCRKEHVGDDRPGIVTVPLTAQCTDGDIGNIEGYINREIVLGLIYQKGIRFGAQPLEPQREVILYDVPSDATGWVEPLAHLGLEGLPIAGCSLWMDMSWFAWPGGYYPRGLGLVDVVLWAKANGVPVTRSECDCQVTGDPPWWDGASGQAEAEERLASHLGQLDFWWSDLLHHIRTTDWW